MKKILIKRLIYSDGKGNTIIGAEEYDGALSNANILNATYQVGKHMWIGKTLWFMRAGVPTYRVTVGSFYQYQKRWYEKMLDAVRRI